MIRRSNPEVLVPAGTLQDIKTAVDFGADAVYCGGKSFGMRSGAKNLSLEDIRQAVEYVHDKGARLFVTINILPSNDEVPLMNAYLGELVDAGVDALIVTDIGILMYAHEHFPDVELHVSTQMGVTNYQAANALHQLGASRVVLARELSLEEIAFIRENTPETLEIECFVHGSMCVAFSGRCLVSKHLTGRDANHGDCTQSCRWRYHVVEETRPGQYFPIEVDDQGTHLFNSEDMNLIAHLDKLIDAGITSLKIEGRAKGNLYVATMANAYKTAVNEYMVQRGFESADGTSLKPFKYPGLPETFDDYTPVTLPDWILEEPHKVTHRPFSTGFYFPENPAGENTQGGYVKDWHVVGNVLSYDEKIGRLHILLRNKITPGNTLEFVIPGETPRQLEVPASGLLDDEGNEVEELTVPMERYSLPCDVAIPEGSIIRALRT